MSPFSLSAKSIKSYTKKELNYELTWNAFELLNERVKAVEGGRSGEEVNGWVRGVLNRAKDTGKRIIKRKDIEASIMQLSLVGLLGSVSNESVDTESDEESVSDKSDTDKQSKTDYSSTPDNLKCLRNSSRCIEITQLPSVCDVKELEDEIERLKKIIQIILNKQAELA